MSREQVDRVVARAVELLGDVRDRAVQLAAAPAEQT